MAAERGMTPGRVRRATPPTTPRSTSSSTAAWPSGPARATCVIESRLAGWIATTRACAAVAGLDRLRPEVRAQRVAGARGRDRRAGAVADNDERQRVERARYLALYGIDLDDLSIYDLVLDSGELRPSELADRIVDAASRPSPVDRHRRGAAEV